MSRSNSPYISNIDKGGSSQILPFLVYMNHQKKMGRVRTSIDSGLNSPHETSVILEK